MSKRRKRAMVAVTAPVNKDLALRVDAPERQYQELWFTLARLNWTSMVLVPADASVSAALIAHSLAEVARWLRETPVTLFIMSDPLDYVSATQVSPATEIVGPVDTGGKGASLRTDLPGEKTIVAVQSVLVEPLGLAVTRGADAVVICIERGQTRLASVRRTIELIGRDRVTGCVFIH